MTTKSTKMESPGLGTKKSLFIMVTVVGCIAILWPKVFHPIMFGASPPAKGLAKEHRGSGCCDVVLDSDEFSNVSMVGGEQGFRKRLNLITGELSLRQERPPHLRPDALHPAMREKGRAIPSTQTVPIVQKPKPPATATRIVDGRPGPIPGMRPPMGAGSVHQAAQKGNGNMGLIMPIYTVGIVAFFVYTIMKLICKKPASPVAPYEAVVPSPKFKQEVFDQVPKRPSDAASSKLGWKEHDTIVTAIQGLIDAADTQLTNIRTARKESERNGGIHTNGDAKPVPDKPQEQNDAPKKAESNDKVEKKQRDNSNDRSVKVLGMEMTTSSEGGQKRSRPPTPVFSNSPLLHPREETDIILEPQSIYLEGALPHDSQILVSDAEVKTEEVTSEFDDSDDEPAVVLSSKMTLSLVNMDYGNEAKGVVLDKREDTIEAESSTTAADKPKME